MSAVRRFLDLGSGHLPRVDRERLDEAVRFGGLGAPGACMAGPYGWFVHVPEDTAVGTWDGTPALAAMVFFILCAPSFLGGSVPVYRAPMMMANR